jgi:hypothetical protein
MSKIKATLTKLWNGEVPLAHTFWLYYFVGVIILRLVAGAINPVFGIVIVAWAGFMVLPIWRSADKYSGNNLFALLAKIAAVLIAIGAIASLL